MTAGPRSLPGSLMQNQPDQTTLSMRNDPDGLIMPEAWDATAIDDLEDASFGFYGGVSSLIEQAPHVTVALRRPVAVVDAGALFFAGAGTDPVEALRRTFPRPNLRPRAPTPITE